MANGDCQAKLLATQQELKHRQSQLLEIQAKLERSQRNIQPISIGQIGQSDNLKIFFELISQAWLVLSKEGLSATISRTKGKVEKIQRQKNLFQPDIEWLHKFPSELFQAIKLETSQSPKVSIIIPVHNKFLYTYNCLKSLSERLDSYINFEVIVVDDASTDETEENLKIISGIRILRNSENLGFIRSCNYAAAEAKGKFLCFLNNDTQIFPGWLEYLLLIIEKDRSVGAVGSKLIYPDGKLQEAGGIIWQDASGWNYGRLDSPHEPEYNYLRQVDYCSGASLLVRAEVFRNIGGFSETFLPAYYEDTDLCFSLRKLGYKVLYQPKSKVIHYEGVTSGTSLQSGVKQYQEINRSQFKLKWQDELAQHLGPDAENVNWGARRLQGKQTILIIDSYVPLYDRESGSCRLFGIIKILIDLGYFVIFLPDNGFPEEPYTSELQEMGVEVLYSTPQQPDLKKQLLKRLSFIDKAWICRPELSEKYWDIIRHNSKIPVIYDTIDLHFLRLKRQQQFLPAKSPDQSWEKFQQRETTLAKEANATVVVTEVEKDTLKNLGIKNVWVIPNIHHPFPGAIKEFEQRSDLLFIGSYNHPPNIDAVIWLCQKIMPLIWQSHPEIKVTLLGSNPPEEVKSLESDRVVVTGYVSDVEPYFLNSRVFVAPLRFGAGMKGKIGHSMSYGLPTVTTFIGAEGMGLIDGYDIRIADEPEIFAQRVLELYSQPKLWNHLSQNSLMTIQQYSPESIKESLSDLLESTACRK